MDLLIALICAVIIIVITWWGIVIIVMSIAAFKARKRRKAFVANFLAADWKRDPFLVLDARREVTNRHMRAFNVG